MMTKDEIDEIRARASDAVSTLLDIKELLIQYQHMESKKELTINFSPDNDLPHWQTFEISPQAKETMLNELELKIKAKVKMARAALEMEIE